MTIGDKFKKKYGSDYYARIGRIGGQKGTTGGFYGRYEFAQEMGRIGGKARVANLKNKREK